MREWQKNGVNKKGKNDKKVKMTAENPFRAPFLTTLDKDITGRG